MGWLPRPDLRAHRHKVEYLAYALRSEETGNQDIRVRLVKLFAFRGVRCGSDLEAAALEIIQNSGEHAGRVESRKAEPVDRSVLTDQRGGLQRPLRGAQQSEFSPVSGAVPFRSAIYLRFILGSGASPAIYPPIHDSPRPRGR